MAQVDTVEIRSPKDPTQKAIINREDYDESVHTLWGEDVPRVGNYNPDKMDELPSARTMEERRETQERAEEAESEMVQPAEVEPEPADAEEDHSAEDFVQDDDGNDVVNVINPDNRRSRMQIPVSEYDPDKHELWSTHPRFHQR